MAIFQPQIVGKGGSNQDIQYDVMPEATIENLGRVIQYVGDTIPSTEASAIATQIVGSSLTDLVVDVEKFEEAEKPTGDCTVDFVCTEIAPEHLDPTRIWVGGCYLVIDQEKFLRQARNTWPSLDNWNVTHFCVDYHDRQSDGWVFVAYHNDSEIAAMGDDPAMWGVSLEGEVFPDLVFNYFTYYTKATPVWAKNGETINLADYGVSYTGALSVDDTISVAYVSAISGITKGYFYENQAKYSDPSATISQTVGSSLSNLSVNVDKFIETEQPTQDETVDFVSSSVQYSVTPTHWNNYGLDITIDDANIFINQILERRPDVSITREGNNIQNFYFCCIYDGQQINKIVIMANSYQTEYNVDSSWGVTINGDQSDDPNTWRDYYINTVSVEDRWVKDDEVVNISDYGISYEGLPVEGDTLTVEYVDSKVIGYNWIQKDVQDQPEIPEVGIDWKTKLDVPADYPQSYAWSCAPIYTVPGGLPDGKYEVYWQILCPKAYNNENIPFGKVTYKAEFGIYTSGSSRRTYGRVSYVMSGEWLENGDYMPNDSSYSNILRQNGEDLIFFSTNTIFRTTIVANSPNTFVPECFKLSAFKNLDTGEEYIAIGDLYMGINPSYTKMINGSWSTRRLAEVPFVPNYRYTNSGNYDNYNQYIYLSPENCIANKINNNYVSCASIDFDIKADNGDEYHVIVENSLNKSSIAKVQKATGNLSNVQIGYNENGRAYVYLNTPADTNDHINYSLSLIGSERQDASCWMASGVNNFTPIAETRVGSAINENNIGHIEQYIGATDSNYTNGYFYKATGTEVFVSENIACEQFYGQYSEITVNDCNTFINTLCSYWGWGKESIIQYFNRDHYWDMYNNDGEGIRFYFSAIGEVNGESAQTLFSCMSFNPMVEQGNFTRFYTIYTPEHREYIDTYWEQVNVQPGSTHDPITPGTHTKITYNSEGLVTAGGELSESDIPVLQLSKISGVVASTEEVNKLHGLTPTTTELNYVNGVTSNIQDQLTNKVIFRNWN